MLRSVRALFKGWCMTWRVPKELVELRRESKAAQSAFRRSSRQISSQAQNGFGDVIARGAGLQPYNRHQPGHD